MQQNSRQWKCSILVTWYKFKKKKCRNGFQSSKTTLKSSCYSHDSLILFILHFFASNLKNAFFPSQVIIKIFYTSLILFQNKSQFFEKIKKWMTICLQLNRKQWTCLLKIWFQRQQRIWSEPELERVGGIFQLYPQLSLDLRYAASTSWFVQS